MHLHHTRRRSTGVSLIEALVALAVMSFGMMALLGVQTTMRYNGEVARQVSEATRLASEELERVRFFNDVQAVAGQANPAWEQLASVGARAVTLPGDTGNTSYELTRTVTSPANTRHKVVQVLVRWTDRSNQAREVTLDGVVAGIAPTLSALLSIPPSSGSQARRQGRHPAIPPQAVFMPDGSTSAFKPSATEGVVWRFNNVSGDITHVCTGVSADQAAIVEADLSACTAVAGRLVSGSVRFHGGSGVTSADALAPAGPALPLNTSAPLGFLDIADFNQPVNQSAAPQCFADSPVSAALAAARSEVRYQCLVFLTDANGGWGGKLDLALAATYPNGDTVPGGAGAYKVCRYTKASSHFTANADHPKTYCRVSSDSCTLNVKSSLGNQNFLVIGIAESCPTATPAATDLVNPNTLPHQP